MPIRTILSTAGFTLFAAASGCRTIEYSEVFPCVTAGCGNCNGPVVVEPFLREPVAAPVAEACSIPAPVPSQPQPAWPGTSTGLIYEWSHGNPADLEQRGKFRIDKSGVMHLSGGAALPQGLNARLLEACSQSDELCLEITLMTDKQNQRGPARIVSFSRDLDSRNFTLGQDGDNLVLRLRTKHNNNNGTNPQVTLTKIVTGQPMHVVVSYRSGLILCCVNGRQVSKTDVLKGDFHNWEPMTLIMGDEVSGGRDWNGSIERLAIRNRFLNPAEAAQQFALTQQDLSSE